MKNKLSLMLLLVTFLSFAQNKFEPGYYIDNSGTNIECFIKNYEWKNNPKTIEIKNSQEDNSITKSIDDIKEFGINNKSKFIKTTVKIDESSQNTNTLTNSPNSIFVEKTVLLKVLVEGKSNLYYFENENYERFFYSVNDKIEQLVYKQYNNDQGNISTNDSFKQQLYVNFKCNDDQKSIVTLKYNNNDLIDYFIKTNNCISGKTETKAISEKKKFETNFMINLLLNSVSQKTIIPFYKINDTSKKTNSLSFGFEVEVILPYNNKNWSFIFDPSYTSYKETNITNFKYYSTNYAFVNENKISLIRLPLGIRRYFTINKNNKIYTNLGLSVNLSNNNNNSNIINQDNNGNINSSYVVNGLYTSFNFVVGLGYQYKKYNIEFKFNNKTTTYANYTDAISLNQMSLKLGYKLF